MTRRAAKVDANQGQIVETLRRLGCSVAPLHAVGGGVPDLLVGYRGLNYCVEIKDGSLPPSERKLTARQVEWHEAWRGSVLIIKSIEEAVDWIASLSKIPHQGRVA